MHVIAPRSAAILALTGGGIMARFTTRILEELQSWRNVAAGASTDAVSIREAFDVLAGTSAGALCVAGLVVGRTPVELSKLLDDFGPRIFPDKGISGKLRWAVTAKYNRLPLVEAVDAMMAGDDRELGEIDQIVAFPAIDETDGKPVIFTNADPAHKRIKLRDAVLSSAAAPTYFSAHRIETTGHRYVDGGLFANAPDLAALTLARQAWPSLAMSDLHLVSIGATNTSSKSPYSDRHSGAGGIFSWAIRPPARILKLAMRSQVDHAMDLLPQMGLADFIRIDRLLDNIGGEVPDIDNASETARKALAEAGADAMAALNAGNRSRLLMIVGRRRWNIPSPSTNNHLDVQ